MKNIILTGQPRCGKSTILETVVQDIERKTGFLTREVRKQDQRIGFKIITSTDQPAYFAGVDIISSFKVSRYGVDLEALDWSISSLPKAGKNLLYIDEIGEMQLYSKAFQKLVTNYLDSSNFFLGTMSSVYEHPFIQKTMTRPDVTVLTINPRDRDQITYLLRQETQSFR